MHCSRLNLCKTSSWNIKPPEGGLVGEYVLCSYSELHENGLSHQKSLGQVIKSVLFDCNSSPWAIGKGGGSSWLKVNFFMRHTSSDLNGLFKNSDRCGTLHSQITAVLKQYSFCTMVFDMVIGLLEHVLIYRMRTMYWDLGHSLAG